MTENNGVDLGGALRPGSLCAFQLQVQLTVGLRVTRWQGAGAGRRALIDNNRGHR